jgi:hypothetical protein
MKRPSAVQVVTGCICDPFFETNIIVSKALCADLILVRDFNARLLEDLQPWVGKSLTYTHPLFRLIDKEIGHKVFSLTGNILP